MEEITIAQGLENAPPARPIREEIFLQEQGFSTEFDEEEERAWHLLLFLDGEAVATGRLFPKDGEDGVYVMGRVAVRKPYRGRHLGQKVVRALEEKARQMGGKGIYLGAQTHAQTVNRRGQRLVLESERFRAAEDDAVDDDQRNEHAKALGDVREKRLQAQINDRNEARDDDDVARDTHFIRNDFAQKGNKDVGKRQDDENGDAHAKAVCNARGDGHGGAHTEHLHQNGVLVDQTVFELFVKIHRSFPLSQFMASAAARAALTPLVTPLVETVAPVTASMFCLTTSVPAPDLPTN